MAAWISYSRKETSMKEIAIGTVLTDCTGAPYIEGAKPVTLGDILAKALGQSITRDADEAVAMYTLGLSLYQCRVDKTMVLKTDEYALARKVLRANLCGFYAAIHAQSLALMNAATTVSIAQPTNIAPQREKTKATTNPTK